MSLTYNDDAKEQRGIESEWKHLPEALPSTCREQDRTRSLRILNTSSANPTSASILPCPQEAKSFFRVNASSPTMDRAPLSHFPGETRQTTAIAAIPS